MCVRVLRQNDFLLDQFPTNHYATNEFHEQFSLILGVLPKSIHEDLKQKSQKKVNETISKKKKFKKRFLTRTKLVFLKIGC